MFERILDRRSRGPLGQQLSLALLALVIGAALLAVSCSPKPAPTVSPSRPKEAVKSHPAPTDLTSRAFHKRVNLSWITNRDDSTIISGYNIYFWCEKDSADTTNGGFRKVNPEPYPGDLDPDIERESFPLANLENGVLYRAYVTTLFPDNIESERTNIVEAIPRPEGRFTLHESFRGSESGYSLKRMKSLPTDDLDNDIYLATINGALYVASPQRIDNVLRQTKFFGLGIYAPLDEVQPTGLATKPDNALRVYGGQVIVLQDQDDCYALLRFDDVDAKGKTVKISYIYQPRPATLRFH